MATQDPGLDRHDWESRFASVEADLRDDPQGGLPELRRLVGEMLEGRGYDPTDPVASAGDDPEVIATFESARDLSLRCEAGDAGPGDIGEAVLGLTAVYEHLLSERQAP
ncbi:MAG: hypothetical protein ICV67_05365 [Thermoleophilia bacterium]|nr:hypothetical protein [Thermoleophilia bacterium]